MAVVMSKAYMPCGLALSMADHQRTRRIANLSREISLEWTKAQPPFHDVDSYVPS
jgi:hypothetical protein